MKNLKLNDDLSGMVPSRVTKAPYCHGGYKVSSIPYFQNFTKDGKKVKVLHKFFFFAKDGRAIPIENGIVKHVSEYVPVEAINDCI